MEIGGEGEVVYIYISTPRLTRRSKCSIPACNIFPSMIHSRYLTMLEEIRLD